MALVFLASMVAKSSQLTCDTDLRRPGMMCHVQPSPDLCCDVTSHSGLVQVFSLVIHGICQGLLLHDWILNERKYRKIR